MISQPFHYRNRFGWWRYTESLEDEEPPPPPCAVGAALGCLSLPAAVGFDAGASSVVVRGGRGRMVAPEGSLDS